MRNSSSEVKNYICIYAYPNGSMTGTNRPSPVSFKLINCGKKSPLNLQNIKQPFSLCSCENRFENSNE